MRTFRVPLIGDSGEVVAQQELRAATPDDAAVGVTNEPLKRYSGGSERALRVKVYLRPQPRRHNTGALLLWPV
jgi:hypothetical protein